MNSSADSRGRSSCWSACVQGSPGCKKRCPIRRIVGRFARRRLIAMSHRRCVLPIPAVPSRIKKAVRATFSVYLNVLSASSRTRSRSCRRNLVERNGFSRYEYSFVSLGFSSSARSLLLSPSEAEPIADCAVSIRSINLVNESGPVGSTLISRIMATTISAD